MHPHTEQLTEVVMSEWKCACGANLYIDEQGAPRSRAETCANAKRVAILEARLKAIIDEPSQTMSDGKALKQIIRHAKLALSGQ